MSDHTKSEDSIQGLSRALDGLNATAMQVKKERDALLKACRESLRWFDELYPADVFTGKAPDTKRIATMRESCREAIKLAEGSTEA